MRLIYRKTGIILVLLVLLFGQKRPQKGTCLFLGGLTRYTVATWRIRSKPFPGVRKPTVSDSPDPGCIPDLHGKISDFGDFFCVGGEFLEDQKIRK